MRSQLGGLGALVMLVLAGCAKPAPQVSGPQAAGGPALAPDCEDLEVKPQVDGPLSQDPQVAAGQQARAEFALPSDEDTVRAIMTSTAREGWPLGFPHTDDEFAQVVARNRSAELAPIRHWAEGEAADSFAGLWLDQTAGGVLTMAFAAGVDRYRQDVHERFGPTIQVVGAERTYRQLRGLADHVSQAMRVQRRQALSWIRGR